MRTREENSFAIGYVCGLDDYDKLEPVLYYY